MDQEKSNEQHKDYSAVSKSMQAELDRRVYHLKTLYDVSKDILERVDFEAILKNFLFMTTGNYDCPERKVRGKDWFYFMPEGHIYIFSNSTMKKYLNEIGFSKILVTNQGDLLMNKLFKNGIIEKDKFKPSGIKRSLFSAVRSVNHLISSGMRIYAIK